MSHIDNLVSPELLQEMMNFAANPKNHQQRAADPDKSLLPKIIRIMISMFDKNGCQISYQQIFEQIGVNENSIQLCRIIAENKINTWVSETIRSLTFKPAVYYLSIDPYKDLRDLSAFKKIEPHEHTIR